MALGKRLFTGGTAACLTETTDIFGDSTGKALYSMDYDASDTSRVYDGTPTNVDFGVSGKTVNGARFNGSSSKIDLPSILPANSNADSSFTCWFRTSDTSGNQQTIVNAWNGSTTANNGGWALFKDVGNVLRLGHNFLTSSSAGTDGSTNVGDGNWHFVAVVFDYSAGTLKLFLDGNSTPEVQLTSLTPNTPNIFSGSNLSLGYQAPGGPFRYFPGTIDQVRIFSKALSQSEMDTLYNSGNGETACVHTSTTDNNDFPVTNAAYYKLDNSAEDEKGTSSSETDIEYRFGRYGQAAIFDGANSVITNSSVGTALNVSAFTFSLWFKTNVNDSTDRILISSFDSSGNARFYASVVNSGLSVVIYGSSSTYIQNFTSTVGIGNWYHLAVTHTGTTTTVYLNGTAITPSGTSGSAVAIKIASSPQPLTFGQLQGNIGTYPLNGSIDQVRIFTSALSAENVLKLTEEKPETDTSNFKAVLYKGTAANQYISNVGMDLETDGGLVWIKDRTTNYSHALIDSVRGVSLELNSNDTSADYTETSGVTSLEKNGFFLGSLEFSYNKNNDNYVSWVWKGGGAPVTIAVNSITGSTPSRVSSVSANPAAGFSIVSLDKPNTNTDTYGHGLSSVPEMIILKRTASSDDWHVYHKDLGNTVRISLNSNAAKVTGTGVWASTTPTASLFTLQNQTGGAHIAYCFHSVAGYSKISSYSGTGGSGNVQTVGFRPSLVVIKRTNTGGAGSDHWLAFTSNVLDASGNISMIRWDTSETEFGSQRITFQDTSFTLTDADASRNATGGNYIYIAFK